MDCYIVMRLGHTHLHDKSHFFASFSSWSITYCCRLSKGDDTFICILVTLLYTMIIYFFPETFLFPHLLFSLKCPARFVAPCLSMLLGRFRQFG